MIPLITNHVLLEVTIPGAQSTLQDFKLPESGGGYTYDESNSWLSPTSNRFIVWRINKDTIELKEISMDMELEGNELHLRLQNLPILDGVSIHETPTEVVVLFATVGSVHRLSFPHPKKLHRISPNVTLRRSGESIFANFSETTVADPVNFYAWNNHLGSGTGSVGLNSLVTNCSWLKDGDAIFVLANNAGSLVQMKMSSKGEKVMTGELKESSLIGKLRGFVPSIMRGSQEEEAIVSLTSHHSDGDTLLFALSRDLRIRIWSYAKQRCLLSHSLLSPQQLELIGSCVRRPFLRTCQSGDHLFLSLFLSSMDQKQFMVYKLLKESSPRIISLKQVATINLPLDDDVVDFKVVASEIWSLCLDSGSKKPALKRASFQCSDGWQTLFLHSDLESKSSPSQLWQRDEYIKNIFHRGKFSLQSISMALAEFSSCPVDNLVTLTFEELMAKVVSVIQNEVCESEESRFKMLTIISQQGATTVDGEGGVIQSEDNPERKEGRVKEGRVIEGRVKEGRLESWEKFHSLCLQYQSVAMKPLSLILDPKTGLVSLVTKSTVSFVPRHDLINQVLIGAEKDLSSITDDPQITSTLGTVLDSVCIVNRGLTGEAGHLFEQSLRQGLSASQVGQLVLDKYLLCASIPLPDKPIQPLKSVFTNIHVKTPFLIDALDALLKALTLDPVDNLDISDMDSSSNYLDNFFSSSIGTSLVAQNLNVFARIRFNFCRDFLLFQLFVFKFRNTLGFSSKANEKIRAMSLQTTIQLVHSYFFLTWVSEAILGSDPQNRMSPELTEAQLNVLGLVEFVGMNRRKRLSGRKNDLLSLFIERKGGSLAKKILGEKLMSSDSMLSMVHQVWKEVLPQYTVCVAQLLWPLSSSFLLPEFLLGHSQLQLLEDYVCLCDPWIHNSTGSREFLSGYIHLSRGLCLDSIHHFTVAASCVGQEMFLQKVTQPALDGIDDHSMGTLFFNYYNKIIQLVSNISHPAAVVKVANQAIVQLNEEFDDQHEEHLSQLYTTLFLNQLDMGNYDEAYQVMILNPDSSTKNDRLRQFVVKMFEKNSARKLVSYPFQGLSEEFIQIIETKAKSNDLSLPSSGCGYYEVLFSFHSKEGRHRRAASVMFELGRRLGQEVPGIESLRKQVSCFLITLNSLRLVEKKYQWIVKPTLVPKSSLDVTMVESCPKRPFDVDRREEKFPKKEVQVLGIEDIKIEYELSNCRLKLLERDPRLNDLATSHLQPSEVVSLLLSNSMFDTVLKMCRILDLSLIPVFESLVSKYIRLVQLPSMDQDLDESVKEIYDCFGDEMVAPQDLIMTSECAPAAKVWYLIQSYLEVHEEEKSSKLHKCITEKLLSSGVSVPTSLKQSYQKRNCPQYLWLLMSYNYVEEAAILALEYLDAILGRGTEYFDLIRSLAPTSAPVYIPHNHFQNLLKILSEEENSSHSLYQRRLYDKIQEVEETSLRYSRAFLRSVTT